MAELRVVAGIPGATCIATARRLFDARYATRWFVGTGLDIGPGPDSLGLYAELFPRITGLMLYDQEDGDAQTLDKIEDNRFDFAYSSHCLEHVRDPLIALRNWIRVVRPGGHLIFAVPDEDMYEQGQWPSRFNSDHKLTFTMSKRKSWSPVSVNMLSLLTEVNDQVVPLKVEVADHGYRSTLAGRGFDQTRTPLTDAAIEVVLRKL
jgi:SAM-dependent methyltransferase